MKILIVGPGKSGTTALLYKIASAIPDCKVYQGGRPGSHPRNHPNAIYKHTMNPHKGRGPEVFQQHVDTIEYDKCIWITRDPRDRLISASLFRWHAGAGQPDDQFRECLRLLEQKEKAPRSVSFHRINRLGVGGKRQTLEEMIASVGHHHEVLTRFATEVDDRWLAFKYEDLVDGRFDTLSRHLGVEIQAGAEVPRSERRIVRRKGYGDWRHWFTEEDVEVFRPIMEPFMKAAGYDTEDWRLDAEPQLDPEFASAYVRRIAATEPLDLARRTRRRLAKSARGFVKKLHRLVTDLDE